MEHSIQATNLADLIERILDKGIVIAGDIQIQLADIELLTIKIRLLLASIDKAREIGIDWWETDSYLSSKAMRSEIERDRKKLEARIKKFEARLGAREEA